MTGNSSHLGQKRRWKASNAGERDPNEAQQQSAVRLCKWLNSYCDVTRYFKARL